MPQPITRIAFILLFCLGLLLPAIAPAEGEGEAAPAKAAQQQNDANNHQQETITTLQSLLTLQADLKRDIKDIGRHLEAAQTESEKNDFKAQLAKLETDLKTTTDNLRGIAAGADIASLRPTEPAKFSLQEELFSLLEPALKEMKDMTSHVRLKSELREKIAYYQEKKPVAELAVTNIMGLLSKNEDPALESYLQAMLAEWNKQLTVIQSELQSAELQLDKLVSAEVSIGQASQSYLKSFFQQRGLYLGLAILSVVIVLLLSRLSYWAMVRMIPGYRAEHRSFRLRLLDLIHRMITVVLAIIGPMVVFYQVEDWVLFSLGILLLLGIGLTLRHALPHYWQQIQLFLNIGAVREGERIELDGLPWCVRLINIFSELENPTAELRQRVRINDLVELKSRPIKPGDSWFPCKRDDWVILADGMRGKVTSISQELVELTARGGARRTYKTPEFLAQSPLNLTRNFRLKETIGISYDLQGDSVAAIPDMLKAHIEKRAADEGYGDYLNNLRVEFEKANTSSLDIVAIADFDGEVADLYGRLGRALQRWCVEACTINGWEIPFTQLTLHHPEGADAVRK